MTRFRASVALASLVASLVMTVGGTLLPAEAASAVTAPHGPYPPTAPALTVNRGTVRAGSSVRASGNGFRSREWISIKVLYQTQHSSRQRAVLQSRIYTNRRGGFSLNVRLSYAGTAIIQAYAGRTGRTASAAVRVLDVVHGHGHGHGR